jgi:SpoVK/Ycf46/Vps4 family AAA+-type ATPase
MPSRAFSLCLYGPPGTGKSAYVRYLADSMGMEVLAKRASDLLSKWVGETERNIARAFEEARAAGAFLLFDEADSLLGDRRGAVRSWEVTQVNEMLARIESHDLPFACTTNLFERLDEASLRRFTFKMELRYLTSEQAAAAFRLFFGMEPPESLSRLSVLTPGDFAAVAKRFQIMRETATDQNRPDMAEKAAEFMRMLTAEHGTRRQTPRRIGFRTLSASPEFG